MSARSEGEELLLEAEWRRCRRDFAYWASTFWHIQTPGGPRKFELRGPQIEGFEAFEAHPKVITLKARQIGWTTLVAAYAMWKAFFNDDFTIIFLSRGEREANSILRMVDYGYKRFPQWLRDRGPKRLSESLERFPMANGSLIESLPSKKDPARGRTVNLVVVDEWAFLENAEDAWASIEPITDVGGRLIGLSTANGSGNFFHTWWEKAVAGVGGFHPLFFPWSAVPERDAAWYEQKRQDMLQWQLHQEYPTTPEEAFIKSGNPVFDSDALRALVTVDFARGFLLREGKQLASWRAADGGELEIVEFPRPDDAYVIGADVAEGLEHGDASSAHVIGVRSHKVVAHWHGRIDPDLFGEVLADLGYWYGKALVGVEANNHGHTTLAQLRREQYPNIYYQWTLDERSKKQTRKMGWHTTRVSKPLMIDELGMELRNLQLGPDGHTVVSGILLQHAPTIRELITYVRDEKGQMSGSPFDDRVISLAIANQMRKFANAPRHTKHFNTEGTFDWWVKNQLPSERVTRVRRMGATNVRSR